MRLDEVLGHPSLTLSSGEKVIVSTGLPKSILFKSESSTDSEKVTVNADGLVKTFELPISEPLPGDNKVAAVIGYDILKSLSATISCSNGRYKISFHSKTDQIPKSWQFVPLELRGGVPTISASLDGIPTRSVLETRKKDSYLFVNRKPGIRTKTFGDYFETLLIGQYKVSWPRFLRVSAPEQVAQAKIEASIPIESLSLDSWSLDAGIDRISFSKLETASQDEYFLSQIIGCEVRYALPGMNFYLPGVAAGALYIKKAAGGFLKHEGWSVDAIGSITLERDQLSDGTKRRIIELIDSMPLVKMHILSNEATSDSREIEGPLRANSGS